VLVAALGAGLGSGTAGIMRPLLGPVGALIGVDLEVVAACAVVGAGEALALVTSGLASIGGVGSLRVDAAGAATIASFAGLTEGCFSGGCCWVVDFCCSDFVGPIGAGGGAFDPDCC
jgi:hypothetical protein